MVTLYTEDIVAFMDNMLVGTEDEKKYDEVVEEVLRKMKANNLYLKPEKCIWKVKEINFLGLVIETDSIKMQKKKVLGVLEWPRPEMVKNMQKFLRLANYYR